MHEPPADADREQQKCGDSEYQPPLLRIRAGVALASTGSRLPLVAGRFNREGQIFGRLKTIVRLLLQTTLDDARQRQRDVGMRRAQFRRRVIQHRVHALDGRVAPKCPCAAEHFVKHTAERKDVRAMIRWFAAHLFRRHVSRRAQDLTRLGGIDEGVGINADGGGFAQSLISDL